MVSVMPKYGLRISIETEQRVTATIFSLPMDFYASILESLYFKDTEKQVDLETVKANRNDYDWMKDLKQKVGQGKYATFKAFNGDLFTLSKCK